MSKALHVIFHGRVQGVWFRAWTAEKATRLGLSGWIRNRTDGTVEAVFSGSMDTVDAMIKKANKGPILARVDKMVVQNTDVPTEVGFCKRPTV